MNVRTLAISAFGILAVAMMGSATNAQAGPCDAKLVSVLLPADATAKLDSVAWHERAETVQIAAGPGATVPIEVNSHCEIKGGLEHRSGENGQSHAIRFHLPPARELERAIYLPGGGGGNRDSPV